jgi:hypothetical protein
MGGREGGGRRGYSMIPRSLDQSISVIHPFSLSLAAIFLCLFFCCANLSDILSIHLGPPFRFYPFHQPNLIKPSLFASSLVLSGSRYSDLHRLSLSFDHQVKNRIVSRPRHFSGTSLQDSTAYITFVITSKLANCIHNERRM